MMLLSDDSARYEQIAASIRQQHPQLMFSERQVDETRSLPQTRLAGFKTIIAIGSHATELAIKAAEPASRILSTFIPSNRFQRLAKDYALLIRANQLELYTTFLDQPMHRQLALARLIQPQLSSLGFVIGEDSKRFLIPLKTQASNQNIALKYVELRGNDSPIKRIQPIIHATDAFLVLPDRTTFNPITAKWLLYLSYKDRVPLIASSRNYVTAGAIAACITEPEDAARATAEQLQALLNKQPVRQGYSHYFSVVTNPTAARKLELRIATPERLTQQLIEAESE